MKTTLLALLLLGATAAPAQAVSVGISEQKEDFLHAPLFRATGIQEVRRTAPWDSVYHPWQRSEIDRWMFAALTAGKQVMVSFGGSRGGSKHPPSPERYARGIGKFIERYPWIRAYSSWNEPNLGRTRNNPKLIAQYYKQLKRKCLGCKVIGAEVVDSPNMASFLRGFKRSLKYAPELWGLHNYNDANRFTTHRTQLFLKLTKGKIWLSETGGIVRKKHRQNLPTGERHQAKATRFVLDKLAPISERVERVYLYHWKQEAEPESWDSGLVRADETPRASYFEVEERLDPQGKLENSKTGPDGPKDASSSGETQPETPPQ